MSDTLDRVGVRTRLRASRQAAGLSCRALDAAAGLGSGHTSLIESGARSNISLETAMRLAGALHVSLQWLATGED